MREKFKGWHNYLPPVPGSYGVQLENFQSIRYSLYDGLRFSDANRSYRFFAEPIGTGRGVWIPSQRKTLSDSNMVLPSQLPAMQRFMIESLSFDVIPGPTCSHRKWFSAESSIRRLGNLQLQIKNRIYITTSLSAVPGSIHSGQALIDLHKQGKQIPEFWGAPLSLEPDNLLISGMENFVVTVEFPAALPKVRAPVAMYVRMNGTLFRPEPDEVAGDEKENRRRRKYRPDPLRVMG